MQYNFSVCHVRMKDVSDLHRGLVGRCCQSQLHLWISCALALAPLPPAVSSAVHSEGAGVPGLPSFSISTDVGKWVPRKWLVKGTWREPGAGSVFSFFALTGGVEIEKMLDLRMRSVFCFGQKMKWGQNILQKCTTENNTISLLTWPLHCCIIVNGQ